MSSQVHLCAETAPFLYSRFTPTVVKYRKGSRPALEALIQKVILRDGPRPASDQDMLFRVWDWVWRGVHRRLNQVVWSVHHRKFAYLGTAEDIAAFRCRADCYCSSRLSASLLQVAGIPARLVYMFAPDKGGGIHTMHTGAEAFIKGAWRFFDPLCHDYAVRPDGEMASFWEIATDRYCQTVGMRADPAQPDKVITDPRVFDDIYIHNYPIEETTAHYRRSGGSYGFDDDPAGARRVARFGL
jgi:hypothetical protein